MNVWYCMDSAIAPDRHSDSAVDSSSVLPVLVLLTSLPRAGSRCDGTPGPPTQNRPRNIRVRAKGSVVLWQCLELASSRWPGYSSEPVLNHGGTVAWYKEISTVGTGPGARSRRRPVWQWLGLLDRHFGVPGGDGDRPARAWLGDVTWTGGKHVTCGMGHSEHHDPSRVNWCHCETLRTWKNMTFALAAKTCETWNLVLDRESLRKLRTGIKFVNLRYSFENIFLRKSMCFTLAKPCVTDLQNVANI